MGGLWPQMISCGHGARLPKAYVVRRIERMPATKGVDAAFAYSVARYAFADCYGR
jgi:hypothetical protein